MKNRKIKLDELNVKSFTTSASKNVKGGNSYNCYSMDNGIAVFCHVPIHTTDCNGN